LDGTAVWATPGSNKITYRFTNNNKKYCDVSNFVIPLPTSCTKISNIKASGCGSSPSNQFNKFCTTTSIASPLKIDVTGGNDCDVVVEFADDVSFAQGPILLKGATQCKECETLVPICPGDENKYSLINGNYGGDQAPTNPTSYGDSHNAASQLGGASLLLASAVGVAYLLA
jgi:hypothetical protein